MSNIKNFGLTGVNSDVQFGKSGGRLVYDSGNTLFKVTGSDGSTLIPLRVGNPVNDSDVVTKQYADSIASGLDPKESVRVATTTDIGGSYTTTNGGTFTGAATTVDTVTLIAGDRVLVKNQIDQKQNGIYEYTGAGGYVRAEDSNGTPAAEVSGGNFTFVESGATNINIGYVLQGSGILTLNTDNLVWVQFSGAGSIEAGVGLSKTGNTLDLDFSALPDAAVTVSDEIAFGDVSDADAIKSRSLGNILNDLDVVYNVGSTNGVVVRTAADTYTTRSLSAGSGISISNTDFALGNPSIALDINALATDNTALSTDLTLSFIPYNVSGTNYKINTLNFLNSLDIVRLTANGFAVRTAADTYASRTLIIDPANNRRGISISNGDGIADNPSIGLNIDGITAISGAVDTADSLIIYDSSATANVRITVSELSAAIGGGGGGNAISQGNSNVTVTDAGTGNVVVSVDATTVATFVVGGATINSLAVSDLTANRVVYASTSGELVDSANLTFNGTTLALTGTQNITGQFNTDNIRIDGNTISSTDTNGNITLVPDGTGEVVIGAAGPAVISADSEQSITISSGSSSSANAAGDIIISAGDNSSSGNGGNVTIQSGDSTSGTEGKISLIDANSNTVVEILNNTASSGNHIGLKATTTDAELSTIGTGTNIGLAFSLKGTGVLKVVSGSGNYESNISAEDDIPNKKYVDDAVAAAAPSGAVLSYKATVDLATTGTTNIGSIPANATVLDVLVKVTVAANGTATMSVGDATNGASSYMTTAENDTQTTGIYEAISFVENGGSAVTAQATVSAGTATVGTAIVIVKYRKA